MVRPQTYQQVGRIANIFVLNDDGRQPRRTGLAISQLLNFLWCRLIRMIWFARHVWRYRLGCGKCSCKTPPVFSALSKIVLHQPHLATYLTFDRWWATLHFTEQKFAAGFSLTVKHLATVFTHLCSFCFDDSFTSRLMFPPCCACNARMIFLALHVLRG